MSSPFQNEMVKMYAPLGGGSHISIAGYLIAYDKDGTVELPRNLVEGAKSHGLTLNPPEKVKQEAKH